MMRLKLLLLAATAVALTSACAATHTIKTQGSGSTGAASTESKAPSKPTSTSSSGAKIGSRIVLSGNSDGEKVAVTVTKVVQSARPSDEFSSPSAGDRFYAVQFRLNDIGTAAYSDSPSNGAQVVDSKGQSYDSTLADVSGCPTFPGQENIASGSFGLGCIVFEVPKHAVIKSVQFTLDSGFGPDTGEWKVG